MCWCRCWSVSTLIGIIILTVATDIAAGRAVGVNGACGKVDDDDVEWSLVVISVKICSGHRPHHGC